MDTKRCEAGHTLDTTVAVGAVVGSATAVQTEAGHTLDTTVAVGAVVVGSAE